MEEEFVIDERAAHELATLAIPRLLVSYATPAIIALIALAAYETVDSLFVGRFVGDRGLSVVMLGFPFFMLLHSCCNVVRVGATSILSRQLGAGDAKGAAKTIGNCLVGLAVFGVFIALIGYLLTIPILKLCGAPPDLLEEGKQYAGIITLGAPFLFLCFGTSSLLRATGHPNKSLYVILVSCGINIIFDYIFVGILPWGVFGAAFATVLSQVVGAVYGVAHFLRKEAEYPLARSDFALSYALIKEMCGIGFGYAALEMNLIITVIVTLNMLTRYGGEHALAQNMVVESCIAFLYLPLSGVDEALQPIIGYNYGAGNKERTRKAIFYAMAASAIFLFLAMLVVEAGAEIIAGFFIDNDPEFVAATALALRIVFILAPLVTGVFIVPGVLSALGEAKENLWLTIGSQVLVQIPALLILPRLLGVYGVWYSYPLYDIAGASLGIWLLWRSMRRHGLTLSTASVKPEGPGEEPTEEPPAV